MGCAASTPAPVAPPATEPPKVKEPVAAAPAPAEGAVDTTPATPTLVAPEEPPKAEAPKEEVKAEAEEAPVVAPSGPTRRPIVGGNWKCNPESIDALEGLVANINACDTSKCDVYVCPSTIHLGMTYDKFTNGAKICPQNCNFKGCGAFTGEMAVEQMKSMGIEWVLIGHSERRGEFGLPTPAESDELLATKLKTILAGGLNCVLAIGEPLPVREKGLEAVLEHCVAQLTPCVPHLDAARVVIAYEPVWSIGTGVTASPEQAQETHAALRKWIADNVSAEVAGKIRIQYGGSANAKNAPELSKCPDVDGFLVGGASLKPEFADIVKAISEEKGC